MKLHRIMSNRCGYWLGKRPTDI